MFFPTENASNVSLYLSHVNQFAILHVLESSCPKIIVLQKKHFLHAIFSPKFLGSRVH